MTIDTSFKWWAVPILVVLIALCMPTTPSLASEDKKQLNERIILVHGLGRTTSSMWLLSRRLEALGYEVVRIGYRSISDDPTAIIKDFASQVDDCCLAYEGVTHFVGHSLGGLVIRAYLDQRKPKNMGRVVLMGSPSNGTEIVDKLRDYEWFQWLGPTTLSLGSDLHQYPDGNQVPDYSLGVIAGISDQISRMNDLLLPGDDDGLVAVESTKVEGMKDFLIVKSSHAGLRYSKDVSEQVVHFLQTESFQKPVGN